MFTKLLNVIDSYLILRSTVRDLETWLLSNLQQILNSDDIKATELANKLDADFIELGEGLIDEATIRERFESYIKNYNTIPINIPINIFESKRIDGDHATSTSTTFNQSLVVHGLVENQAVDWVLA